jgi:hypothetical protein
MSYSQSSPVDAKRQARLARQLQDDYRLIMKYSGKSIRAFVKIPGKQAYRKNPALDRFDEAVARVAAASDAGVRVIVRR